MTDPLAAVRTHLRRFFTEAGLDAEPATAKVTFLGAEPIEVLRFGPGADGLLHYLSVGCSRHPMVDPTSAIADTLHGPRAEVVVRLRDKGPVIRLARSLAILAATPAVDGVVLTEDALIDFGSPLWETPSGPAPFTAALLGRSDIPDFPLQPMDSVRFLSVTPITATEAAWVRLKGAEALREAWRSDGVDVLDPNRPVVQAN
ncbi:MAG: suppressor of fused domain protein [Mycobacterium sp.]|nr:suppressor of fused domain protein [Mycobacterium sp.]